MSGSTLDIESLFYALIAAKIIILLLVLALDGANKRGKGR